MTICRFILYNYKNTLKDGDIVEEKKNNLLLSKLSALWTDDRKYLARLLCAAASVFVACFMFIFAGPFEIVANSGTSLAYSHKDIAFLLISAVFVVTLVLTPLLALLRGKVFDITVTLISSVTLAGYVQSLFFNGAVTTLTGDAVDWTNHTLNMILSLVAWSLIIGLGFFVLYLGRNIWKNAVLFLAFALFVMCGTSSVTAALTGSDENAKFATLSTDGMYEYSKEDNTFVFVLDRLDYRFIQDVLADDPTFLDKLDGFTQYTDAISTFSRTKPAINHMFTGSDELAYTTTIDEFRAKSWTEGGKNILADIKKQGYDIDIYALFQDLYVEADHAKEYIKNLQTDKFEISPLPMLGKMLNLSVYRYAPTAVKPFFETDTNYYNAGVLKSDSAYTFKDSEYAPGFKSATADGENNNFKFYHFNGPHAPYYMNSDGTKSATETSLKEQTMGSFNILYSIFDRMKELGIYEDATIIILGDHGTPATDNVPLPKPIKLGLFYKPSGSAGTPLAYSTAQVSNANIPATILKSVGADYSVYGSALDDIGEDDEITRVYYKAICPAPTSSDEYEVYKYHVTGDAANFDNWKIVERFDIVKDGNFY